MKRKKIKIHYGNLFLVICLVLLLGGGIYFLYNQFNDNDEKIENNSNEEKDLINKLQFVFDDYHEYMNMPLIKERLKTLKTQYNLEISSEKNENGIV